MSYDVCGCTLALYTLNIFSDHFHLILLLVLLYVMLNKNVPPYDILYHPIAAGCLGLGLRLYKMNANQSVYIMVEDQL